MSVMPVHRQFGSKARVAPLLLQLVPTDARIWIEVFAGTAAMTLAKTPHRVEHINDLNGGVVNLFRVLRDADARDRLCEAIEMTPWAQQELIDCQYDTYHSDPVEHARRFLVASWQTIGGKQQAGTGWRIQRDESWPMGTWRRIPDRIRSAAQRLKEVYIHRRHCFDMVDNFRDREDALFFLDPPYPLSLTGTHRQQVYEYDMSEQEHWQLAMLLRRVRGKVILTMAQGSVYDTALGDWRTLLLPVRGMRNTVKNEVVFLNFEPPKVEGFIHV